MANNFLAFTFLGGILAGCCIGVEESCKKNNLGKDYRGTVTKTRGGFECQRWDLQTPHSHKFKAGSYADAGLVENYCRNPDGEPDGPWCYTTSKEKRWDYCDLPSCSPDTCKITVVGKEYRGMAKTTKGGLECQRWTAQTPHKHIKTPDNYLHAGLVENYCRNPDGESKGPWCYTTSKDKRWDYCNVSLCGPGAAMDFKAEPMVIEGVVKLSTENNSSASKPSSSCLVITLRQAIYCTEIEDCPDTTVATNVNRDPMLKDDTIPYKLVVKSKLKPNRYLIGAVWNRGWCHEDNKDEKWIRNGDFFNDVEHSIKIDGGKSYTKDIEARELVQKQDKYLIDEDACSRLKCENYGKCKVDKEGSAKCVCKLGCPRIYMPVCGSDGKDYGNKCVLEAESCKKNTLITVAKQGECKEADPCSNMKCENYGKCEVSANGSPKCVCQLACPLIYKPVCGSDGKDYANDCVMKFESCDKGSLISVAKQGQCNEKVLKEGDDGKSVTIEGFVRLSNEGNSSASKPSSSCLVITLRQAIYCTEIEDCPDTTVATIVNRDPMLKDDTIPYKLVVKSKLKPNRYLIGAVWNRGWCHEDNKDEKWIRNGDFFNDVEHSIEIDGGKSYTKDIEARELVQKQEKYSKDDDPCSDVKCGNYGKCESPEVGAIRCVCQPACPMIYKPVCGSNGKDYANRCVMEFESCDTNTLITVAKQGKCKEAVLKEGDDGKSVTIEGFVRLSNEGNSSASKPSSSCLVITLRQAIYCTKIEDCPDTTVATIVNRDPMLKDDTIPYKLVVKSKLKPNRYLIGAVWNRGWCHEDNKDEKWIRNGDFFNDVEHSIEIDGGKSYTKDIEARELVQKQDKYSKDDDPCSDVKCGNYGKCEVSANGSPKCVCQLGCPMIYKPVCGSNGKDYANRCVMEFESCDTNTLITVAKQGKCKEAEMKKKMCELKRQSVLDSFPVINGEKRPLLGAFIPQCEEDGSYKEVQCHGSTGYCWCVEDDGTKIDGTQVKFRQPDCKKRNITKCEVERQGIMDSFPEIDGKKMPMPGAFIPKCEKDGSYKEVQCHGSTGYCWCVDQDGKKRKETEVRFQKPDCKMDPCSDVKCGNYGKCEVSANGSPKCVCQLGCPMIYKPVCGSNGKDYANRCVMEFESCDTNTLITVAKQGKCEEPEMKKKMCELKQQSVLDSFPVINGEKRPLLGAFIPQCEEDGSYKEVQCHGSTGYCWCVDQDGKKRKETEVRFQKPDCKMDPCSDMKCGNYGKCESPEVGAIRCVCQPACPMIYKPVCGSNGKDYANRCVMEFESCDTNTLITVAKQGKCKVAGNITKCEVERQGIMDSFSEIDGKKMPMPGAFIPKCEKDGSYKEIQCHGSTGYCWCVDQDGKKRKETEIRFKQPDCSKIA